MVPAYSRSFLKPAMLSAAVRPWRAAGPARATIHSPPSTGLRTSTASPTAQMLSSEVRMCGFTTMPPRALSATPADFARAVSARTPRPRMITSAGSLEVSESTTSEPWAAPSDRGWKALMGALRCTATPCASSSRVRSDAISGSKGAMSWGRASTMATVMPRWRSCSAISMPMKPPPATTAVLAPCAETAALMRSMSSRFRSAKLPARSMPGIGGAKGLAPMERVSAS
mmetsp:Transcript_18540/g.54242  ORF Transcript_18540/g.54242 Transcript_18540/m.54242 type:complete len:228 (-) Transcript_18540:299-982(-)